jgi:hypothetical protein
MFILVVLGIIRRVLLISNADFNNNVIEDFSLSVYYRRDRLEFSRRREMLSKRLVSIIVLAMIVLGVSMLVLWAQPVRASSVREDLNGDGKVDIKDVAIVGKAFGSYPGHPRWNSAADLNGDGVVDALDLALVAKGFGKTAS